MGLKKSTNTTLNQKHDVFINSKLQLQQENLYGFKRTSHSQAKKKNNGNIKLKLRRKTMQPINPTHYPRSCRKRLITANVPIPTSCIVTNCYPCPPVAHYPVFSYPPPILNIPQVPVMIPTLSPIFATPYIGPVIQPLVSPILPPVCLQDNTANISGNINDYCYPLEPIDGVADLSYEQKPYVQEVETPLNTSNTSNNDETTPQDSLDSYLKLPKELFPSPNMMDIDPNPLIDEFCKITNLQRHLPWLLDLEFGIPKSPMTRPIPIYNVKLNTINCKDTPDTIHPGFQSCHSSFKKKMLYYYDCVISSWYKGYTMTHMDHSIENFESWLQPAMQFLGMCWP